MSGILVLVGTPIGDVADASERTKSAISSADLIAAEDTRRFFRLAKDLNIDVQAKVISFHESKEQERIPVILEAINNGSKVVLLTDAGMPSISDPGYRIVAACVLAGIEVDAIPGPSAVTMALALSGLATDRFCFEGFLSRKTGERQKQLVGLAEEVRTMVFFEAPHRLLQTLDAMQEVFGQNRQAVVCRELTKTYQEVKRATLGELKIWAEGEVLGEITLVVAGADPKPMLDLADPKVRQKIGQLVKEHELATTDRKSAISQIAVQLKLPKREVYDIVVRDGKE